MILAAVAIPAAADDNPSQKPALRTLQGADAEQVESLGKTIDQLESRR